MIGEEGQAFYYATSGLETARAHTAARAIGLAQGALGRFDPLRRRAPPVRQLDLGVPGDPLQDRGYGDPDRGGAPAQLLRLRADRHRPALRQGSLDGQAVRLRDGRARQPAKASRSMAARATPRCTPSSATGATPASPRSSRAPRRSRSASSRTACSAAGGTDEGLRPHRKEQLLRGLHGRRRAEARARQDHRAARAGLDHQRDHEHRRRPLQRAPDEERATSASGWASAASPSRCASALPPRTRPRTRWPSSASTRSASRARSITATRSTATREVLESRMPTARRRHRALQALRREPGRQARLRGRAHGADQATQPLGRQVTRTSAAAH